jgi:hypothetical protein
LRIVDEDHLQEGPKMMMMLPEIISKPHSPDEKPLDKVLITSAGEQLRRATRSVPRKKKAYINSRIAKVLESKMKITSHPLTQSLEKPISVEIEQNIKKRQKILDDYGVMQS